MTGRPGRSGAEAGFPSAAHARDKPADNHHRRPQDGFSETIFDQPPFRESFDFTRRRWPRTWSVQDAQRPRLRNDLHIAIGLLELANVGDFPANYWNTIPIPKEFEILMYLGGLMALSMLWFVCLDAKRSWENIQGLRSERTRLNIQKRNILYPGRSRDSCECFLGVNKKELWSETDRFVMVVLLGAAALMVGIGTCIAPSGEDHAIFTASNYLTGHVGNSPCAIYGVVNVVFASFVCLRAFRQQRCTGLEKLENDTVKSLVRDRTKKILIHSLLNGITVLCAGAAAMCTATYRLAYVGLAIASVASFYFSWFWRRQLGYGRQFYDAAVEFEEKHLVRAISHTHHLRGQVSRGELPFGVTMEYIVRNHVLDELYLKILRRKRLRRRIREPGLYPVTKLTIRHENLVARVRDTEAGDYFRQNIENTARRLLLQALKHRERWLLEMLGCHITISGCGLSSPTCEGGEGGTACDVDLESCSGYSDLSTASAITTPEASPDPSMAREMNIAKAELG